MKLLFRKLLKFCLLPVLGFGLLFIFNACKKEVSPQEPAETDISGLPELFAERGYESNFIQPFGDTLSIIWTPLWDNLVKEAPNDSTTLVIIKLVPQLKNIKTGNIVPDAHFAGFAKYINAEITKTTTFYIAEYTTNSAVTEVNLDTFTGSQILRNLENGKIFFYKYLNGKQV